MVFIIWILFFILIKKFGILTSYLLSFWHIQVGGGLHIVWTEPVTCLYHNFLISTPIALVLYFFVHCYILKSWTPNFTQLSLNLIATSMKVSHWSHRKRHDSFLLYLLPQLYIGTFGSQCCLLILNLIYIASKWSILSFYVLLNVMVFLPIFTSFSSHTF